MIKKLLVRIFLLVCVVFCVVVSLGYAQEPDYSVVYKIASGDELYLHVFDKEFSEQGLTINTLSNNRPAIVFFHGGGWSKGSWKQFAPHADYLSRHGIVAICAEYRLVWVHGTTPYECVEDAKSAIRWVRANSYVLGIDPNRILAAGGSAGGHLALCSFLLDTPYKDVIVSSKPNGFIIYNGVLNTHPEEGWGGNRIGETWEELSPFHHLRAGMPDTIIFHGDQDRITPVENAIDFYKASKALGNNCLLYIYEGQEHGFFNFDKGPNPKYFNMYYYQIMLETLVFLRRFDKKDISTQNQSASNPVIFGNIHYIHK